MIARYYYVAWLRLRLQRNLFETRWARDIQQRSLLRKVRRHENSDFGRDFGFSSIRTAEDFRRQVPILSYEEHRPYVNRVWEGQTSALFAPDTRVLMFAMTSGTTGEPKRLPITKELFKEYCAGWRLWGGGVYGDHFSLAYRKTLQLTSDWQQYESPCGIPCGQISGLAANTRPRMTQRAFTPPPITSRIHDAAAKHYTTLRMSLATSRVGMIITANPSTLVDFARRADKQSESLLRDIHDGTLSCDIPADVRDALGRSITRRNPRRARQLAQLAEKRGALLPMDAWPSLTVLAVWTGGSVGVFMPQLADLYGQAAVRDHGLSASEGRMTIPLADGTPAGLLDYRHHYFEFIPAEEHGTPKPTVLEAHELEVGRDYYIVMTTSGGLYRYDIHDVVRCVGYKGQAPMLEFLNKGKNFSNLTGEKISEHQVVRAVQSSFNELNLPIDTFTLAPVMEEQPRYVLVVERGATFGRTQELAASVQANLVRNNEEYASKCESGRLLPVAIREMPPGTFAHMRRQKTGVRGNFEEYKHPCLVDDLQFVGNLVPGQPPISAPQQVPGAVEVRPEVIQH